MYKIVVYPFLEFINPKKRVYYSAAKRDFTYSEDEVWLWLWRLVCDRNHYCSLKIKIASVYRWFLLQLPPPHTHSRLNPSSRFFDGTNEDSVSKKTVGLVHGNRSNVVGARFFFKPHRPVNPRHRIHTHALPL